jgi:hypothetical protein
MTLNKFVIANTSYKVIDYGQSGISFNLIKGKRDIKLRVGISKWISDGRIGKGTLNKDKETINDLLLSIKLLTLILNSLEKIKG